ncbi:MAG: hypothetical protein GY711_32435 [bacterium]|nr:hypothetical protein [bacterium]
MQTSDPLTTTLLPVVLHKLNNATQLLVGLNTLLGMEGGEELALERSGDLADASRTVHRLGWAMAVIASGNGSDLLLERREPEGLAILIELAVEAARRSGGSIAAPVNVPSLAPEVLDGWQIPWGVATVLLAATADVDHVEWTLEPERFEVTAGAAARTAAAAVLERLPGARLESGGGALVMRLPVGWLVSR